MNKEEFIKKLRKRLDVLENKEVEDIVSEYEGYIEEKVKSGMKEEDAVKELGDFEEIVSDLLAAYKVKSSTEEEGGFTKLINKISHAMDIFIDSLNNKSAKDVIKILIEIVIILFIICLLKIPFAMIKDLGGNIFNELSSPIGSLFEETWYFLIELSYAITAVVFFIKMFEKRYIKKFTDKIVDSSEEQTEEVEKKENKKKENNKEKQEEKETKPVVKEENEHHGFIDTIADIGIIFLKFIAIIILIGVVFYLIGMAVALGIMIYLLINGVQYFGVFILIIAMFLGGVFLLELGINFCFNKKIKAISFFSKLITLIIITGVGLTFSALEIANTEIIYENYYKETKSVSKEITMTSDIELYNYDKIVIDNNLKDKIKIEYVYPDLKNNLEVNIELENCGKGYCLHTDIQNARWNKEFLDVVIENLKERKIYAYEFSIEKIIYLSEENYNILIQNNSIDEVETSTFTSTYYVVSKISDTNEKYVYLTIYEDQMPEETTTVKISSTLASNVESGGIYEFTFEYKGEEPDDNIEDIFDECKLIDITYTDLNGLE